MIQGMCARDPELAKAAVGVARTFGVAFMGLAGTQHEVVAKELGVPFLAEWFAGMYPELCNPRSNVMRDEFRTFIYPSTRLGIHARGPANHYKVSTVCLSSSRYSECHWKRLRTLSFFLGYTGNMTQCQRMKSGVEYGRHSIHLPWARSSDINASFAGHQMFNGRASYHDKRIRPSR